MLWQSPHDRHLEDYDFEDPEDLDDLAFMDALRDLDIVIREDDCTSCRRWKLMLSQCQPILAHHDGWLWLWLVRN